MSELSKVPPAAVARSQRHPEGHEAGKREWRRPQFQDLGSVRDLTSSKGSGTNTDTFPSAAYIS
jgi:hypothetical protein